MNPRIVSAIMTTHYLWRITTTSSFQLSSLSTNMRLVSQWKTAMTPASKFQSHAMNQISQNCANRKITTLLHCSFSKDDNDYGHRAPFFVSSSKVNQFGPRRHYRRCPIIQTSISTSTSTNQNNEETTNQILEQDIEYMKKALEAAEKGVGNTYPNPAVGCVLVDNTNDSIIGTGFHPKAGYPHAEVFALFEACGHVQSGIDSALTVVQQTSSSFAKSNTVENDDNETMNKVNELLKIYSSDGGAEQLFENKFQEKDITAYVTLEPCCHYGQTPPCAMSLFHSGVKRVIVGFRDPNPRVDGGGVSMLRNHDVQVDLLLTESSNENETKIAEQCADIVKAFAKRITPRSDDGKDGAHIFDYDNYMNGAKRSALRSLAGKLKNEGTMKELQWPPSSASIDAKDVKENGGLVEAINELPLAHGWMETVDSNLWEKEMILLRLNNAIAKKKGAKLLGERIAKELNAHVTQVVGHTVLLYRPGLPPVLDIDKLLADKSE